MKNSIMHIWMQLALGFCSRITGELLLRFESISDVYNCDDFSFLGEKREKYIRRLENKDTSLAFEIMKRCETRGIRVTGCYDEHYPKKLRAIGTPPAVLYSIGDLRDLNNHPCVAIVGTRKMSDYGKATAENLAYNIAKSGAYVISGLAKGIDTAAHRGAVMADGYTVAVLGNPIGDIYPRENEKAFFTLYERGLVMSELYPGAPRTKADFPNRNRIISALSDIVVIAEAGEGSGAIITAKHAMAQSKKLFAVPGTIGAENAGTNKLIKTGVPIVTEAYDILSPLALLYPEKILPYEPSVTSKLRSYGNKMSEQPEIKADALNKPKPPEPKAKIEINPEIVLSGSDSEKILSVLSGSKPLSADEIAMITGLPVSAVMTELTLMEIDGSVTASVGGRYSAV